mmetsp:Transcript_28483/g.32713  ORF Transcript_28483/g.32713 Transcript_28483/m.32713 type:complete len:250 (-) Transcript_28483:9-758(-)
MCFGHVHVDGRDSVYWTPLANSDAACNAFVCTLDASFNIRASSTFRCCSARSSTVNASCNAVADSNKDSTFFVESILVFSFSSLLLLLLLSPSTLLILFSSWRPSPSPSPSPLLSFELSLFSTIHDVPSILVVVVFVSIITSCLLRCAIPPIIASFSCCFRFDREINGTSSSASLSSLSSSSSTLFLLVESSSIPSPAKSSLLLSSCSCCCNFCLFRCRSSRSFFQADNSSCAFLFPSSTMMLSCMTNN